MPRHAQYELHRLSQERAALIRKRDSLTARRSVLHQQNAKLRDTIQSRQLPTKPKARR
jgi:cell division protein FtsB